MAHGLFDNQGRGFGLYGGGDTAGGGNVDFKTGAFSTPTGTGAQDLSINGVGFKPKALIIYGCQSVAQNSITVHSVQYFGISDGTNDACSWIHSLDGGALSDSNRYHDNSSILQLRGASDGNGLDIANVKTFDADGFTLEYTTKASTTSVVYNYIAIGGDITAAVGNIESPSSTGVQSYATGLDTADMLMLISCLSVAPDSKIANSRYSLSVATATGEQRLITFGADDNVATTINNSSSRLDIVSAIYTVPPDSAESSVFNGFTSTGFDLNWTPVVAGTLALSYLTIKGGSWGVLEANSPASATTKLFPTPSRTLKGAIFFSDNKAAHTGANDGLSVSIGATDFTNDSNTSIIDIDNVATSDTARQNSNTKCYRAMTDTSTVGDEAGYDSHDTDGITLDFTTADATERRILGLYAADKFIPSGFDPRSVPGLEVDLDANYKELNGSDVSMLIDQSGKGNHAIQNTAANQPLWNATDSDFNNEPSLTFDGVSEFMQTLTFANSPLTQPNTIFIVSKWVVLDTIDIDYKHDGILSGNRHAYLQEYAVASQIFAGSTKGTTETQPITTIIEAALFNGVSSAVYRDGGVPIITGNAGTHTLTGLTLGSIYDGTSGFANIKIARCLIYNGEPSDADKNLIGNALATKYGTTWTDI